MRTTNIRFTGLASGLDTESMVEAMVMPYKSNVDSAVQQQKLMELKKDAWKEMNTKVFTFYDKILGKSRLQGTFNQFKATMSKEGIVNLGDQLGKVSDGTHHIDVSQLAEGATVKTKQIDIPTDKDLNGDGVIDENDNKITDATKLKDLGITDGSQITVNGKTITIGSGQDQVATIGELENKLKETLGGDFNVNFDSKNGAFFISSSKTGADMQIDFTGSDISALSQLGFLENKDENNNPIGYVYSGKDAIVAYNGVEIQSSDNKVNINGLDFTLQGIGSTTIVTSKDTEAIVDFVKEFVTEYNKLIEEIQTAVNAPYNKDYLPLTDEQKQDMSEEDIKLWNEKVEKSILRKDPALQALADSMRTIIGGAMYEDENGKKFTLSSFGITTSVNYKEGGKLYIDEDKLREGLNQNEEVFISLFTHKEDPNATEVSSKDGIGIRLYDDVSKKLRGTKLKSSNFLFNDKHLDKKIKDQKDEIAKLEDRMNRMESMYYSQFTAMEKMLSQLNNQSSWLTSQLANM